MEETKIYIGHRTGNIIEGGMARNEAFYNYAKKNKFQLFGVYNKNPIKRILLVFRILFKSFFWKNKKILLHLGSVFIIFPKQFLNLTLGIILFNKWIAQISKNNKIFLEINDLPFEQAKDLELHIETFYEDFQKIIFNPRYGLNYIFAAKGIQDYVINAYNIHKDKVQVIINGAPFSNKRDFLTNLNIPDNVIKFVYAGTSKKGRGIEKLLKIFENTEHYLFLVGEGGDWISNQYKNIFYLGSFEESTASNIISQFDMGIVHYDENKLYYNICYPTKYSFYIASNIPILSTPLKEGKRVLDAFEVVDFISINHWLSYIESVNLDYVQSKKNKVSSISENFYWENILNDLKI